MTDTDRLIRAVRIRQRIAELVALTPVICIAFAVGVGASVVDLISARPVPIAEATLVTGVLLILGMIIRVLGKRIDDSAVLIRIERTLGSSSALLAARDLHRDPEHPFAAAVFARADNVAKRAIESHIIPKVSVIRLPKRWYLVPVFLAVYLMASTTATDARDRSRDESVVELGSYLSDYGDALAARAEEQSLTESLEIAREMQRLGAELQKNRIDREAADRMLSQLADKVQNRLQGLSRTPLPESSDNDAPVEEEVAESGGQGGFPADPDSADVQELYQKLLNEGALSDEEAGFLDGLADELDNPKPARDGLDQTTRDHLEELNERLQRMEDEHALDTAEQAVRNARERMSEARETERAATGDSPPGAGGTQSLEEGGEESAGAGAPRERAPEDSGTGEGESASGIGTVAVEDEFTDDFERSSSESSPPITDIGGDIANAETAVKSLVRNLPEESEATVSLRDLERVYEKQRERAMVREDIPVSVRTYVRDYFIGLARIEESTTDD